MSGPALLDFTPPPELVEHMVKRLRLRDENGVIRCCTCRVRVATVPTLECKVCIERRKPP